MMHHSAHSNETSRAAVDDDKIQRRNESRPPWLTLLIGFLFLDGFFGVLPVLLGLPRVGNLLYALPPFSFMWWYAYEDPWGWAPPLKSFLHTTTPVLELACAWAVWRTPTRIRRLMTIVGAALALGAALEVTVPIQHVSRGYIWDMGRTTAGLAELALAVFAIWFVRRYRSLARPEAALLSAYLILTGFIGLVAAMDRIIEQGLAFPLSVVRGYGSWSYVIARCPIDVVLSSALLVGSGVLFQRRVVPVKLVTTLVVFAGVLDLGMWVFRSASGLWGSFLSNVLYQLSHLCPYVGDFAIALGLAWFVRRNVGLFVGVEPLCPTCRYNLTGNVSGVCPECGASI
jgi:hypothetical protein